MLIALLMLLALLRAESGVLEIQGRAGEPSRLFRLMPGEEGAWDLSLLGFQSTVPAVTLPDRLGSLPEPPAVKFDPNPLLRWFEDEVISGVEKALQALP